ncbi:hypothetical protein [Acidisoma sp. C75]
MKPETEQSSDVDSFALYLETPFAFFFYIEIINPGNRYRLESTASCKARQILGPTHFLT